MPARGHPVAQPSWLGCSFGTTIATSALLLTCFMVLHAAKADFYATALSWPLVMAPLLALPAATLALLARRLLFASALPPLAATVALAASCASSLAFGVLLSRELAAAEGGEASPPLAPATWALALCPLFAATALRLLPRLCGGGGGSSRLRTRAVGASEWQRLSERDSASSTHELPSPNDVPAARATSSAHDTALGAQLHYRPQHASSSAAAGGVASQATHGADGGSSSIRAEAMGACILFLYGASGAMLCLRLGGGGAWSWRTVATPAW